MATHTVANKTELARALTEAKGGDTIALGAGDYGWLEIRGALFDSQVTIAPAPGAAPKIARLGINGARNLRIEGLTIELGPDPGGQLFAGHIQRAENLTITGCALVGNRAVDRGKWDSCPRGLRIYDYSKNIIIEHTDFSFFSRATQIQWIDGVTVRRCTFHDCRADMLFFQCVRQVLVEHCDLWNMFRQGDDHADYVQFDSRDGRVCADITIRYVTCLRGIGNADCQGIFLGNKTATTGDRVPLGHENVLIEYCLIWDTGINGIRIESGKNCTVRHVTVLQDIDCWHNHTVGVVMCGALTNVRVDDSVSNRFSLDAGATGRGNVVVQFRGDPEAADHYSQAMTGPFAPKPVPLEALRPKPGSKIEGKGYPFGRPEAALQRLPKPSPRPVIFTDGERVQIDGQTYVAEIVATLKPLD